MRGVVHLCAIFALLILSFPLPAAAHEASSDALDLGAMMLTPSDLADEGLEGYALRNGWTDTLDEELIGYLEGAYSADEIEETLDGAGYQRTLAVTYDLPSENEPDWIARRVLIYLDEYRGDEGLDDALDIYLAYPDADEVEGTETIGDESRIVSYTDVTSDSNAETEWLVLGFVHGNLTAQIAIGDFATYLPDVPPTVDEIEALGLLLNERIDAVIDDGGPGLANQVLRFESDGVETVYIEDYYTRRGDETLPLHGIDAAETADDDEASDEAGMLDAYALEQWIGNGDDYAIDWNVNVRLFEDDDAASDWLRGVPERAEATGGVSAFEQAEDPGAGDEAVAFSYVHTGTTGDEEFFWFDTLVRVGETVATVSIGRLGDLPPEELVTELVERQVTCLDDSNCAGESRAPRALLSLAEDDLAETPVDDDASGDGPTDEELLARVETFDDLSQDHVSGTVEYEQNPPVGGAHNPVPQTCGFYDEPIGSEHAVHSLEHGAVWVTYDPELPAADVRTLEALAAEHDYLLVSPFDGLPAPVVASAWGVQLQLDGVDDPYLIAFIDYFEEGPQNPEPGASCDGTMETAE